MNDEILMPEEEMIDPEFGVDVCTCGNCIECINRDITYQETLDCACTYIDEPYEYTYINELGEEVTETLYRKVVDVQCERCKEIDRLDSILEKYDMLEKANIPYELWQDCIIHDDMIFTSQENLNSYLNPTKQPPTLEDRVGIVEAQTELQSLMMDDLLFEVIPNIEAQIDASASSTQKATLLKLTESATKNIIKIDGRVSGMAGYLAQKIMDGRDYATVFKTRSYKPYQDEVDTILVMEGYSDLIVRD